MASSGEPTSLPKLPTRAAQIEIQNRISLATSRMSFLQKYRSKRSGPAAPPTANTVSKSSFSALGGRSRPSSTAAIVDGGNDDEADEPPLRAVADPNTGLGHAPKAAAVAATAASRKDDKLRTRLVGKQQRDGGDRASTKRRRGDESSEDEEPGRSGLGRSKKQKERQQQQKPRHDDGDGGAPQQILEMGPGSNGAQDQGQAPLDEQIGSRGGMDQSVTHDLRPACVEAVIDGVDGDAAAVFASAEAPKRKKKQSKKQKKRAKDAVLRLNCNNSIPK